VSGVSRLTAALILNLHVLPLPGLSIKIPNHVILRHCKIICGPNETSGSSVACDWQELLAVGASYNDHGVLVEDHSRMSLPPNRFGVTPKLNGIEFEDIGIILFHGCEYLALFVKSAVNIGFVFVAGQRVIDPTMDRQNGRFFLSLVTPNIPGRIVIQIIDLKHFPQLEVHNSNRIFDSVFRQGFVLILQIMHDIESILNCDGSRVNRA